MAELIIYISLNDLSPDLIIWDHIFSVTRQRHEEREEYVAYTYTVFRSLMNFFPIRYTRPRLFVASVFQINLEKGIHQWSNYSGFIFWFSKTYILSFKLRLRIQMYKFCNNYSSILVVLPNCVFIFVTKSFSVCASERWV